MRIKQTAQKIRTIDGPLVFDETGTTGRGVDDQGEQVVVQFGIVHGTPKLDER